MAAVSATVVRSVVLGSTVTKSAATQSVATFNGLKACPMPRQRVALSRRVLAPGRLTVTAAADPPTLLTVKDLIATKLGLTAEEVKPESTFTDLGADSLDTVEIMMAMEEEFSVNLDTEVAAEKITTVQEAADLIFDLAGATKTKA